MLRASLIITLVAMVTNPCSADDRRIDLSGADVVEISAPLTRLHVTGWAENHIGLSGSDVEQLRVSRTGNRIQIEVADPPLVSLALMVPPLTTLVIRGELADVSVRNVTADVDVSNRNNPISISAVNGSVAARSQLAPIDISRVSGNVRAESNWAAVDLDAIGGDVWARTAGASISLKDSHSQSVELHTLNGMVSFEGVVGEGADYRLASHRGVVEVRLSTDSDVTVQMHGDTDIFSVSGAEATELNDREAEVVVGPGRGKMILESPRGPIRLIVQ